MKLYLKRQDGLLSEIAFKTNFDCEVVTICHEFGGVTYAVSTSSVTILGETFRIIHPRTDDLDSDTIVASINDREANKLANYLRKDNWFPVDGTYEIVDAWHAGNEVDLTQERVVYDW